MSIVSARGPLLVVPEGARIPKACLKCGATKGVVRHEQEYVVGALGKTGPYVGGAIGAGVASVVRNFFRGDIALQVLAITVICVAVAVAGFILHRTSHRVALSLPLCEEHHAQIELARRRRVPLIAGLVLALATALGGMAIGSVAVAVLGLALVVLLVVVARAARMHEAWVHAAEVTLDHVALRVDADLARTIAERAEKRAARAGASGNP